MSSGHKTALMMLRVADRGQLLRDMQAGVDEIVRAIEDARGAGTGEITLKFKISCKAEGAYAIASSLSVKVPPPKRLDTLAFLGEDGELERHDPRQPDLPAVVDADFRNGVRRSSQED